MKRRRERSASFSSSSDESSFSSNRSRSGSRSRSKEKQDGHKRARSTSKEREQRTVGSRERNTKKRMKYSSRYSRSENRSRSRSRSPPRYDSRYRDSSNRESYSGSRHRNEDQNEQKMSFKEFVINLPDSVTPAEAEVKYKEYVENLDKPQMEGIFEANCEKQYFRELYHPDVIKKLQQQNKEGAKSRAEEYLAAFKEGNLGLMTFDLEKEDQELFVRCQENLNEFYVITHRNSPEKISGGEDSAGGLDVRDGNAAEDNDMVCCTLFLKSMPCEISKEAVIFFLDERGCHEGVSNVSYSEISMDSSRHVWITYRTPKIALEAKKKLEGEKLEEYQLYPSFNRSRFGNRGSVFVCSEQRYEDDVKKLVRISEQLNKECGIEEEIDFSGEGEEKPSLKQKMDILMLYLRYVHFFCFYCCSWHSDMRSLQKACPSFHLRRISEDETYDPEEDVLGKQLLDFIAEIGDGIGDDRAGEEINESEKERILSSYVKEAKNSRYRCEVSGCGKLFKGEEFVRKHILAKHEEILKEKKDSITKELFLNNFLSDKNKPPQLQGKSRRSYNPRESYYSRGRDYQQRRGYGQNRSRERQKDDIPANSNSAGGSRRNMIEYRDLDDPEVVQKVEDYRSNIDYLFK